MIMCAESIVNELGVWWCIPLTLALGKQRREDLCEIEASAVYTANARPARTQGELVSKN